MKYISSLILTAFIFFTAQAGDSIQVKINQTSFSAKDSIQFACKIPDYANRGLAAATLNVWVQDIEKQHTWKFRYPVLNGELEAGLAIGDSIRAGKYAVNFILQKGLFKIYGHIKNKFNDKSLNYLMMIKGKKSFFNTVDVGDGGSFLIKNVLFEDEAFFLFTPSKKVKRNDLIIDVTTPLDSTFNPIAIFTQVIDVKPEQTVANIPAPAYKFDFGKTLANTTLPDVVVTYAGKKKVEQYEETYATGLFKDNNGRMFDGLSSDEIARSVDVETFLLTRIPGISVAHPELGSTDLVWRNQPVTIYIDEFKLEPGDPIYIVPSDVAMIKVFPPPASINSGGNGGGAIAIYTKRGAFDDHSKSHYKFTFKGYTALDSVWR
jgi:hypothetical protein